MVNANVDFTAKAVNGARGQIVAITSVGEMNPYFSVDLFDS